VITNTDNTATGNKTTQIASRVAKVTARCEVDFYLKTVKKTITLHINWDDEVFFSGGATSFNADLELASLVLSENVYRKDAVEKTLRAFGFKDIAPYYDNINADRVAHAIARKEVFFDGIPCNIVVVVCRGTYEDSDIFGNVQQFLGFPNFQTASIYVANNLANYIVQHGLDKGQDIKFLFTGHSRGGAVANLLGADITRKAQSGIISLGNTSNVYTYTFASPNTMPKSQAASRLTSNNVKNLVNDDDCVPDASAGAKHGTVRWFYPDNGMKNTFKELTGIDYNSKSSTIKGAAGFGFGHPHQPEAYLSFLLQNRIALTGIRNGIKLVAVKCPVDVDVFDSSGVLVGRVVNNIVDDSIDMDVLIWLEGDEKYFLFPQKGDYTFRMVGTDNGILNYSAGYINPDTGEYLEEKEFKNVALYDGKKMTSTVGDEIATPNVQLLVTNNVGAPIATVNTNGSETPLNTPIKPGIFGTNAKWYGAWWHYLLFFFCFGFIWMWF